MPIFLQRKLFDGTYLILQEQVNDIACYKSALIDLERRRANKGQAMNYFGSTLEITGDVEYIGEGENPKDNPYFQAWSRAFKEIYGQPDRLRRVDTYISLNEYEGNEQQWKDCWLSEAIVGSANIDEIAEKGRNDLSPQ